MAKLNKKIAHFFDLRSTKKHQLLDQQSHNFSENDLHEEHWEG
jgi:hypothetical protein